MKNIITILLIILFSHSAFGTATKRLPFSDNNVAIELITNFVMGSSSSTCPPFVGFDTVRIADTLVLNAYFNISGPWPALGCERRDTVLLGILAPSITVVKVNRYQIFLTDTTNYYSPAFVFIWPVGISNSLLAKANKMLYPNPANDLLHISINQEISSLQIGDVQGQIRKTQGGNKRSIDITDMPPGIYYLYVNTDKQRYVERFMKE